MKYAVSPMKMPHVRDCTISALRSSMRELTLKNSNRLADHYTLRLPNPSLYFTITTIEPEGTKAYLN